MSVTINSQCSVFDSMRSNVVQNRPSFKANEEVAKQPQAKDEVVTQPKSQDEVTNEEPKEKKGFIRRFKDGMASAKKFFIGVGEYTKGTVKGLFYGGIAAGGVVGIDAIRGASKIIQSAKAGEIAGKAVKVLSTKGKVAAGVMGLAVLGYQLFQASLNASEKRAAIDHRWGSGHND